MSKNIWLKRNTAVLLALILAFLQPVKLIKAQAAVSAGGSVQAAISFDPGWKLTETGSWKYLQNGIAVRSAWICDKANGSRWYVLDENGTMAEGPLVFDAVSGKYYLLNNKLHDGTFGSVLTEDGSYYGMDLRFHQAHDGYFGALEDEARIRALSALLGVKTVSPATVIVVGNTRYTAAADSSDEPVYSRRIYTISYDFAGGDDYYENPRGYTKVSEMITLKDPEREGYRFLGWTEGDAVGQEPVKSPVIPRGSTGDRSYTAHWTEQTLNVEIKVNDPLRGSVGTAMLEVPYGTVIQAEGTEVVIGETRITAAATPSTAEKTYTLHDWAAPKTVTEDTTVYANFTDGTDLCTVTLKYGFEGQADVTKQVVKNSFFYPDESLVQDGYILINWIDENGTGVYPDLEKIQRDIVLTAKTTRDLYEDFLALEHVQKVKRAARVNQYYLYFEQPLDWENPASESFIQKVQVILEGPEQISVLNTEGYVESAYSSMMVEPIYLFDGNYICPEHRFFGCSVPAGLCPESETYWQYLTTENAAADTHRVRSELASVLTGKWVSTGTSKGGLTTNLQACYHPEDCTVWMPYVAPFCNGIGDPRFMANLNETIGDDFYGTEKAGEMRKWLMDVMCWCEENRDAAAAAVWNKKVETDGLRVAESITPEILMELCLMDYQASAWQTDLAGDPDFAGVKEFRDFLENPCVSLETKTAKVAEKIAVEGGYEINGWAYPYYIQSLAELGQYYWTTEYLQAALDERGSGVKTAIPADAGCEYFRELILTDALKRVISYDSSTHEKMLSWIGSTDQKIMMIFGSCDPWTAVRIPVEEGKENIKVYILPGLCHGASLSLGGTEIKKEALDILNGWLGITPPQ